MDAQTTSSHAREEEEERLCQIDEHIEQNNNVGGARYVLVLIQYSTPPENKCIAIVHVPWLRVIKCAFLCLSFISLCVCICMSKSIVANEASRR